MATVREGVTGDGHSEGGGVDGGVATVRDGGVATVRDGGVVTVREGEWPQ